MLMLFATEIHIRTAVPDWGYALARTPWVKPGIRKRYGI